MRTSATVSLLLFLSVSAALAQSGPPQLYSMGGLVVVPHAQNRDQMEVRLVSETEILVGRALLYPLERFAFSNLPSGRYYLLMNASGHK